MVYLVFGLIGKIKLVKTKVFISKNSAETQKIGEEFVKTLKNGKIIALYGNLGAGKTTFVQGLAKGLGIEKRITSPTFIIVKRYQLRDKIYDSRFKNLYHIDLYRIEGQVNVEELGFDEIIQDQKNIIIIEWAEKMENQLPEERINIYFKHLEGDKREIKIEES